MPLVKLCTNVEISDQHSETLLHELSKLMADHTDKPERYVMVELTGNKAMLFGGNNKPLAYLECKSIGLTAGHIKSLMVDLTSTVTKILSIPGDRIYIEFKDCEGEFWAWNSATFA